LLALVHHSATSKQKIQRFLTRLILPAGLLGAAAVFALADLGISAPPYVVLFETFTGLFFCWLVNGAWQGFRGPGGALLESRPLVYCGKISYGIYIYQPFAGALVKRLCDSIGFNLAQPGWLNLMLVAAASVLMASVSWYLLEKPITKLKRYFSYRPRQVSGEKETSRPTESEGDKAIAFGVS
jgi:peptidoglycan/LPS O-acetylase OafA/YrhL